MARTREERETELRKSAETIGMTLHGPEVGVFTVGNAWNSTSLMISVNHEDGFYVARKFWGKGNRWRRLGYWKLAASAVRAASYYTDKPIAGWRPRRF